MPPAFGRSARGVLLSAVLGVVLLGLALLSLVPACGSEDSAPSTGGSGGDSASGGTASSGGHPPAGTGGRGTAGGGGPGAGGTADGSGGNSSGGGSGGAMTDLRTFVYVGSGDWGGSEPGLVTVYELNRTTRTLAYVSEHPAGALASYLAIDSGRLRLFAADEGGGGLLSYSIDAATGQLTSRGATASPSHPVYLFPTTDGAYLLAANYSEGSVDVYPIGPDGKAESSLGTTPTGSQAHSVVLDAQNHVFVPNKGAGTISLFTFSGGTLTPNSPANIGLASARHLTLHGDTAYVVSEEADLITAFAVEAGGVLRKLWDVPRLPAGTGSPTTNTGADVRVTPSGKFLYATNRGSSNTIAAYDLQGDMPTLLEHESTLGTTPRNFAIDPEEEFLLVANHGTQKSLVIFDIASDGRLTPREPLSLDYSPFFVGIAELP